MKSHQKLIESITDIHTHYGHFGGHEYTPEEVMQKMKNIGIKSYAIMPAIPINDDDHIPDNHGVLQFIKNKGAKVIPILMTSPKMIKIDPLFNKVSDIPYKIIKIHPYGNNWGLYPDLIEIILKHAQIKKLPVMIHTGYDESEPKNFESWFKHYSDINFILAHGKPPDQAKEMLDAYSNVWVDISFMDINGIGLISSKNNNDRILFGTDIPITEFFLEITSEEYFNNRLNELVDHFGTETVLKWGKNNIEKLLTTDHA